MKSSILLAVLTAVSFVSLFARAEGTNETLDLFGITVTQKVSKAETLFSEGCAYQTGDGVEQDLAQAAKCFREAAELGHAQAQYNYGILCLQGAVEEADEKEALRWLIKSAEQGTNEAYYLVGFCHYNLEAYTEAYAWALMADSAGDSRLKETLDPMFSEEEIAAGKVRFKALQEKMKAEAETEKKAEVEAVEKTGSPE